MIIFLLDRFYNSFYGRFYAFIYFKKYNWILYLYNINFKYKILFLI